MGHLSFLEMAWKCCSEGSGPTASKSYVSLFSAFYLLVVLKAEGPVMVTKNLWSGHPLFSWAELYLVLVVDGVDLGAVSCCRTFFTSMFL